MSAQLTAWATALNGWAIAAIVLASIFCIRLLLSPYWVHQEQAAVIKSTEAQAAAARDQLNERRCTLCVGPLSCIRHSGREEWLVKVVNDGPSVAIGVQMKLTDITPSPNSAPSFKARCPHKVNIAGLTFDALPRNLAKGQTETFEPFRVHPGGPSVPISNMDTAPGADMTIEIGEQWHLLYRVFAENSNVVDLALIMRRNADGSVTTDQQ